MADMMSKEKRSRLMSRIRGKDTTPELYVHALLQAINFSYERHASDLPGSPDFVFRDEKLAVFVDGDFWHGWRFPVWRHRLALKWREKIAKNRLRDRRDHRCLRRNGWAVIRIWEHQIEEDVVACIERIASALPDCGFDRGLVKQAYDAMPNLKRRHRLPKP